MRFGPAAKNAKMDSKEWKKYKEPNFNPVKFPYGTYNHNKLRGSCGTYALSSILDMKPCKVSKFLPKSVITWSDREMKKMLNRHGWVVKELTVTSVKTSDHFDTPITKDHIVLLGQRTSKNEGTWAIAYQNAWVHNFDAEMMSPLEFINNPIMSAYVICRKKTLRRNSKSERLNANT